MDRQHLMKMAMLALAVVALVYMASVFSKKDNVEKFDNIEEFEDPLAEESSGDPIDEEEDGPPAPTEHFNSEVNTGVQGVSNNGTAASYENVEQSGDGSRPSDCFPKDQLTPAELLPSDANSQWAKVNPAGQGELGDQNFLQAGHHVGVNTVGQSLRNANRQLRSDPPNPQVKVSPWMQTTIEPDINRKALEIGGN